MSGDLFSRERFDQDLFGQLGADPQAGVADLADEAALAAEEFDFLFFAETHFSQAVGDLRRGRKLLDADGHTRAHAA